MHASFVQLNSKRVFYCFNPAFSQSENLYSISPGVRPKLRHPSITAETGFDDFSITEKNMGESRLFHLFGIESPGLTSSLGIAESIKNILIRRN